MSGGRYPAALLLLGACTAAAPPPPAPVEPIIEPSEGVEEPEAQLGDGDPEAERCFGRAATFDADLTEKCRAGMGEACAFVAGTVAEEAPTCAAKIRELACNAEHARSCADLAEQLLAQPNRQPTRVRKLLGRACDGGVARACTQLAKLERERLGRTDPGVVKLLVKGCELGDGESCFEAAEGGAHTRRAELLEKGCDLGHDRSCFIIGLMFMVGAPPFSQNKARGKQLLMGLCNGTGDQAPEACFRVGENEKACDKGHFNACIEVLYKHQNAGRLAEAIALTTKLVKKEPNNWRLRWVRGSNLFNTGKHKESIADLEALVPLRPDWPLIEIWLYAARERAGIQGKAQLETAFKTMDQAAWPAPVFKYMLGRISMGQLLKAARDKDDHKQKQQECEAFYYIGQKLMVKGRKKQAKAMFQKSVDRQITDYIEFRGSKAELVLLAP